MTGWVLTLLPVVLGVALYFVNPEMMSILWKNPLGIKLLWSAGIMIVIGGLIIRNIVNMDVEGDLWDLRFLLFVSFFC